MTKKKAAVKPKKKVKKVSTQEQINNLFAEVQNINISNSNLKTIVELHRELTEILNKSHFDLGRTVFEQSKEIKSQKNWINFLLVLNVTQVAAYFVFKYLF